MNSLQKIVSWLDVLFQSLVVVLVVGTPFIFWTLTSEFYETPKFLFVLVVTCLMLFIWALRSLLLGKVTVTKTPLDLPLMLLLVIAAVSTYFAVAKWNAIFGSLPRIHGSLASTITYVLLYFVLVSNLRQTVSVRKFSAILIAIGTILAVLSLIYYAGFFILPVSFDNIFSFNLTGSTFSSNAILILLLPLLLLPILRDDKKDAIISSEKEMLSDLSGDNKSASTASVKALFSLLVTLFGVSIVLTGGLAVYIGAAVVLLLVLFATPALSLKKNFIFLILPLFIVIVLAVGSYLPINKDTNPLYQRSQNYPREVTIPMQTAWVVSVSAFRDSPFWGTGPSSFINDFTFYKPVSFNSTKFWNNRFDQSSNEYFQYLATLGAVGLLSLLLLVILFVSGAFKVLTDTKSSNLKLALAISGISLFVLLAFHTSTLVLMVFGLIILALYMSLRKELTEELQIGIAAAKKGEDQSFLKFDILPAILILIISVGIIAVFYYSVRFTMADASRRQGLVVLSQSANPQAGQSNQVLEGYQSLQKARDLNPYSDLYRSDLAKVNFALANAIAISKGPTESSPSGSLTDQDKKNIQTFLSGAINEGRIAVALNPNSPGNWEVLGSIYQQISGVAQNALSFAMDSYGRAIQRDAYNPMLRLTVGGIYYSVKNYDLAIRFFGDTVNLKPDYANGYYNLAIALRDKGDLQKAILTAEKALSIVDPASNDYQVATNLLSQLRDKSQKLKASEATSSANLSNVSKTQSALSNERLPKVLDLPKAEQIATPEAIPTSTATP